MDMVYDTADQSLSIDTTSVHPWGADLRAIVKRHGQVVSLRGVKMSLTITADGETVADMHLPPPGVIYSKTSQDTLATGRVKWQPDQEIEVTAWCHDALGNEQTVTASCTAPRPPQPYPSWTWQDGRWQAPVPRPDGDYVWVEDAGEWVKTADDPA